jgi:diguanylate cyclase (GGDEF)-like protein
MTASAGVAVYPVHGEDAERLMKSADLALYQAKRAGKNTCRVAGQTEPPAPELGPQDPPAS